MSSSDSVGSVEMEENIPKLDLVQDTKKSSQPMTGGDEQQQQEGVTKKEERDAQARAERMQVRKVSPVKKFFSSIRVIFIIIIVVFLWASLTAVGWSMISSVRILYQKFDELDMKERIQHAVRGTLAGSIALFTRSMMTGFNLCNMLYPNMNEADIPGPIEEQEVIMASVINQTMRILTEGPGPFEYEYLPYQLIMFWDTNWTERLVYYRPCLETDIPGYCNLPKPEEAFEVVEGQLKLKYKDKVPKYFRDIPNHPGVKERNPETGKFPCEDLLRCGGIAPIPEEEGGPMLFYFFGVGDMKTNWGFPAFAINEWHILVAANAKIMNEIQANRTGLCVSLYSEKETNLPKEEKEEFELKRKKKLIMHPMDIEADPITYFTVVHPDTGNWTMSLDYYSDNAKFIAPSNRSYCDDFYDHGDGNPVARSKTYLDYSTFNFDTLSQDNSNTVMFRFDYHDPLTSDAVHLVNIVVGVGSALWIVTILCVFIYFDVQFLHPLDKMRKMREDLIKTALAGLDDDGGKAKELFGDLTDDTALIKANGDEITVMLTLQDRMDALYSSVINARVEELNRMRSVARNELSALRVMNLFMRRDDEALRIVLPGLIDPNEMARRFRRTTLTVRAQKGESWMDDLANAKHVFRTLKAVLSNTIAAQYFKAFCTQRGRSSINSFFFLMDVSWLHQAESGAREGDDFLSAMFSDSVSPSPASMSPRSPYLCLKNSEDGMGLSSDLLVSAESSAIDLHLPQADPSRPHHSHFAKAKSSGSNSGGSSPVPSGNASPAPDDKKPKIPKLPMANVRAAQASAGVSPAMSPATSPGRNAPQFLTKMGDGIAHFIYESYFGRKSLAQHDMRHAALLGCSQIPDYLTLRDKDKVTFSPTMYDNLVTAVTKKFTSEVLPQFLNSVAFQVMVRSLMITGYFDKKAGKEASIAETVVDEEVPEFEKDAILKWMWITAKGEEKQDAQDEDDSDDTTTTSDDDDDDDDNDDNDDKEEKKKPSDKKDDSSSSDDSSDEDSE